MTMPDPQSATQSYRDDLLHAYEAEIAGEAYFTALAALFAEPGEQQKLMLLAAVEQRTWTTLGPLVRRHRLIPRDRAALAAQGETWVRERAFRRWNDLLKNMTTRYPGFVEKFKALEADGPQEDKQALNVLVRHEAALLAFAEQESAGAATSLAPVRTFLTETQPQPQPQPTTSKAQHE